MYLKRQGNTYKITISAGFDAQGKRQRIYKTYKPDWYTKTGKPRTEAAVKKEVEQYARELERQIAAGETNAAAMMAYKDYVEKWNDEWAATHLSPSVRDTYLDEIRLHASPVIGNIPLGEITAQHMQNVLVGMQKKGLKPGTIKRVWTAINSVFRYAERLEIISKNPCRNVELPRAEKGTKIHYFTPDQARTFLRFLETGYEIPYGERTRYTDDGKAYKVGGYVSTHAIPYQYQPYFYMSIYGGFRRGELLALTWNDIDFEHQVVSVTKSAARTKDGILIKPPKTAAGIRSLTLPASVFEKLSNWKKMQYQASIEMGDRWKGYHGEKFDSNFIFIKLESGEMMGISTPTHKFKEIIRRYNDTCDNDADKLPLIKLHDLRHTTATFLFEAGVNLEEIARRLGHSRVSMTLDVYGHALPIADKAASAAISEILDD